MSSLHLVSSRVARPDRIYSAAKLHFRIRFNYQFWNQYKMIQHKQARVSIPNPCTQRSHKEPAAAVRNDKVMKFFAMPQEPTRPFRRKQEPAAQQRRSKFEDVGKLVSSTSLGCSPDLKMIFSCSPEEPQRRFREENKCQLRENKSVSNFDKLAEMNPQAGTKMLASLENLHIIKTVGTDALGNPSNKQSKPETQALRLKIDLLSLQKKQMEQKYDKLARKLAETERELMEKQNLIANATAELHRYRQENERQKEVNRCLEEIIEKLNEKIQQLLEKQNQYLYEQPQDKVGMSKQQLEQQVQTLREHIYQLNRKLTNVQVQTIIISKLRYELQKQKSGNKDLQKQNRNLKQRISSMIKTNRGKPAKNTNNKIASKRDLEYSVSFSFQV